MFNQTKHDHTLFHRPLSSPVLQTVFRKHREEITRLEGDVARLTRENAVLGEQSLPDLTLVADRAEHTAQFNSAV